MEELTIVEMEQLEENEIIEVDMSNIKPLAMPDYAIAEEDVHDPEEDEPEDVEIINFSRRVIDRKEQLCTGSTNMMKNRINSLRLLERNAFRLEVSLFLKLIYHKEDYTKLETYYNSKSIHLSKLHGGESCFNNTTLDSQNLKLKLML